MFSFFFFFFNDTATTEIYTLSLHDALPISRRWCRLGSRERRPPTIWLGAIEPVAVEPHDRDEQQDDQEELQRQRPDGGVDAEHRNARRPLDHARAKDPRLLKARDPLAREHEGHVLEHRARHGEKRLERYLHPEPADRDVDDHERHPPEENARRHWPGRRRAARRSR